MATPVKHVPERQPSTNAPLSWLPIIWALGWVAAFGTALFAVSWPFVDVSNTLTDALQYSWGQTFALAFGSDIEFRPLFRIATKASFDWFGLPIEPYETVVLLQFAAVLALVLWLCRPVGARRALAACIVVSCVAGLHTSRILFSFLPVNAGAFVLILVLIEIAIALDSRGRRISWVFLPLVLLALLSLEWGVITIALALVLWAVKAPGVDRRSVMWTAAAVGGYIVLRLLSGSVGTAPSFHTESGFGFSQLTPAELDARFGQAPWVFWLYNVASTFSTVVFSEPRSGVFAFLASLAENNVPYWQWVHVVSSVLTTVVIMAALVMHREWSTRDRLLCVCGLALLIFGSAFGLPYTRDRMGMLAGVGYALLLYVGLAALLERRPAKRRGSWMIAGCVTLIAVAWTVRSAETYFELRDTAWDFHHEWVERAAELDSVPEYQTPLIKAIRTIGLSKNPSDPRFDPAWTQVLFERRFPINVSRPLSPPFDVRWTAETTDAERQRREAVLGLTSGERVERDPRQRTWTYRLRRPTKSRISAVLTDPAVEDTARIDRDRLEIVE